MPNQHPFLDPRYKDLNELIKKRLIGSGKASKYDFQHGLAPIRGKDRLVSDSYPPGKRHISVWDHPVVAAKLGPRVERRVNFGIPRTTSNVKSDLGPRRLMMQSPRPPGGFIDKASRTLSGGAMSTLLQGIPTVVLEKFYKTKYKDLS